jgi:uroporphyrinogen decarboxylase
MTPRERFKRVMAFKKADRLLWLESQYDATNLRWIREGLPIDQVLTTGYELFRSGSLQIVRPRAYQFDIRRYFGFDEVLDPDTTLAIDTGPLPRYTSIILGEQDDKVLWQDPLGGKIQYRKGGDSYMPHFVDFPVKSMKDWEEYKKRLNPADIRRYPKDWSDEYLSVFENATTPTALVVSGLYAFGRGVMGTSALVPAFYKDPELMHDMMDFWSDYLIQVLRDAVESLKSRIDWIFWHEDLASGTGPNISPKIFKEFMLPNMKKVTSFFNKNGIDLILLDTDGDLRVLMPLLWEGGIRGTWPLEAAAGLNVVELRKQYGNTWRFGGNLDKRTLAQNKDAIKREIDSKVPYMKESSGYIASLDHAMPEFAPLENFRFYADYLKSMLEY